MDKNKDLIFTAEAQRSQRKIKRNKYEFYLCVLCDSAVNFYNFLYMNKADKNRLLLICYNDKLAIKYANTQKVLMPDYKGSLTPSFSKGEVTLFQKRGIVVFYFIVDS